MLRDSLPNVTGPLPGAQSKLWLERCARALPHAILSDYPIVIKRGAGAMIEDMDGNRFLDFTGGTGVLNVGHCNRDVVRAIQEQSEQYLHSMMAVVTHPAYIRCIERMNEIVPVRGAEKQTMLVNSGAESIENAVKIAKAYTRRPNVIVFSGAYHGRTSLTMAMTAKKSYALGMGPFPDGVFRADFPNLYRKPAGMTDDDAILFYLHRLEELFLEGTPPESTAAIVVEPVQGEGGIVPAPLAWVKAVRALCDMHGILLVADEVQCGFARSGRMFVSDYWEEAGCAPDILACAKSFADGLPLGAVTAGRQIMDAVPHGVIGGTFSGNAVACAAACQVIDLIQREKLTCRATELATMAHRGLAPLYESTQQVGDIRGCGSMIGVEFVTDRASKAPNPNLVNTIISIAVSKGLLLMRAGARGNVIRFLYPLTITDLQMEAGLSIFREAVAQAVGGEMQV